MSTEASQAVALLGEDSEKVSAALGANHHRPF